MAHTLTFRERIADWISGGEISRLIADVHSAQSALSDLAKENVDITAQVRATEAEYLKWRAEANDGWGVAIHRLLAMQAAIAMETPGANATVRRMAKVLREAIA